VICAPGTATMILKGVQDNTVREQKPVIKRNPSPACYQHTQRIRYYISAVAAYLILYGTTHASSCTYAYLKLAASAMRSNAVPSIISKTVRLTGKKKKHNFRRFRTVTKIALSCLSVCQHALTRLPDFRENWYWGRLRIYPENPNLVKIVRKYRAFYTTT